jgi:gliding motility-associated-like protein
LQAPTEGVPTLSLAPEPLPPSVMLQRPNRDYLLTLELQAESGCRAGDTLFVGRAFDFFIPSAFTPNGDGVHDTWNFFPLENYTPFYRVEATVFNRAGVVVFQSRDYGNAPPAVFDGRRGGKLLPIGTYYYVVKLVPRQPDGAEEVFTGSVTILR